MRNTGCIDRTIEEAPNRRTDIKTEDLIKRTAQIAEDKKGDALVVVDVRGRSAVTDFYMLVTAGSPPHLKALFNDIQQLLKKHDVYCYRRTGTPEDGWMVLDYVDLIIHLMLPEKREYYALEELWAEAPRTLPQDL